MVRGASRVVPVLLFVSLILAGPAGAGPEAGKAPESGKAGMPAPPPPRAIPGLTAEDHFPHACVDCHLNYAEMNMDTRFSTLLKQWSEQVDPKLLAEAKASAPQGLTVTGKHPDATQALADIPNACLQCHDKAANAAPPFSRMIHRIHLTGGKENPFLTVFQGECTHCHKLDQSTGEWSIPSGPEK